WAYASSFPHEHIVTQYKLLHVELRLKITSPLCKFVAN
ncbi:hypothetical protein V3C99_011938, partial [Haemonchus contortus]